MITRIHTGEKSKRREVLGNVFGANINLVYLNLHTAERPYVTYSAKRCLMEEYMFMHHRPDQTPRVMHGV